MRRAFTLQLYRPHHAHWCAACSDWVRCHSEECDVTARGDFRFGEPLTCVQCLVKQLLPAKLATLKSWVEGF